MNITSKTNNSHLAEKLEIRCLLCRELKEPLRVLDLFAGESEIWGRLRKEFPVASYTPVDEKGGLGVIKMTIDARTVKSFDLSKYNCVDMDSYGDCWELWAAIWPRLRPRTACFITFGHLARYQHSLSRFLVQGCGVPKEWNEQVPVTRELNIFLGSHYLQKTACLAGSTRILSIDHSSVSYYAILR